MSEPGRDAASQYVLHCIRVEVRWHIQRHSESSQVSEQVKALLGFHCDCINVLGSGQMIKDVYSQELKTVESFYCHPTNKDSHMVHVFPFLTNFQLTKI